MSADNSSSDSIESVGEEIEEGRNLCCTKTSQTCLW